MLSLSNTFPELPIASLPTIKFQSTAVIISSSTFLDEVDRIDPSFCMQYCKGCVWMHAMLKLHVLEPYRKRKLRVKSCQQMSEDIFVIFVILGTFTRVQILWKAVLIHQLFSKQRTWEKKVLVFCFWWGIKPSSDHAIPVHAWNRLVFRISNPNAFLLCLSKEPSYKP